MALSDYNPVIQWYADSLTDLDEPVTGAKSNPTGTTDPTLAGTPDSYADFSGSNAVTYTPAAPVLEVGTGDLTIVTKLRVDNFIASDFIWENYDGSGTASTNCGLRIRITAGGSRRIALTVPPAIETTVILDVSTTTLVTAQDFIIAFRRSAGTWTIWLDVDATGGMVANTPFVNAIGSAGITECGSISFGANNHGTVSPFDGRIYWLVAFDAAISDTDIQLAAWDTESNLKAAWLGGGPAPSVGKIIGGKLVGGTLVRKAA